MRSQRQLPPVHIWTEEIDATMVVGCAFTYEVRRRREYAPGVGTVYRRYVYGASCIVLVERSKGRYQARAEVQARMADVTSHGFECLGPADGVEDT